MTRFEMIERIGPQYVTSNIENGEYSYVQTAGSKNTLEQMIGHQIEHFMLDIRFELDDVAVLVETKPRFSRKDESQLAKYVEEEQTLYPNRKIIAILANTNNDKIKVWKSSIDDKHILHNETVLDRMVHYVNLFKPSKQNDREEVMRNTYDLNELLHKMDIDETLRSQFVGTVLLYIKDMAKKSGKTRIDEKLVEMLNQVWKMMDETSIRAAIKSTLDGLLDGSDNKAKKIELLQNNVLNDQKVRKLTKVDWIKLLDTILLNIYRYIDEDSSEGQDILNLFFIAFNKYTGRKDKNQAFTPDHITEFMCRVTGVDRTKVVLDATCGSGSFLVQAMVKELADCRRGKTEEEARQLMKLVKEKHIYGIENEERAYGLATTNMLIHGDGNSNIKFADMFASKNFIKEADPDIILMNPPYNAKPKGIPSEYKTNWTASAKDGKTDATKGMVFVRFISDVVNELNDEREKNNLPRKDVKMAVLLPVSTAIGTSNDIAEVKRNLLENNTLNAVFTLPNEIFYPGASASACCMVFTLGRPHVHADGTCDETFFGYYKEDGFKKKKNLGRVEQFEDDGASKWKAIEEKWLSLFRNKKVVDGLSATAVVDGDSEWLCEAYMKTDYNQLSEKHFKQTINNFFSFEVKIGKYPALTLKQNIIAQLLISDWREFRFGDLISKIYKAKALNKDDLTECENQDAFIRYITRTGENNGCEFLALVDDINPTYIEKGNAITVGDTTATCFYQEEPFITGDHMVVIRADWINKYTGLFIVTLLSKEQYKYSYGRAFLMDRIKETSLRLPSKTINGNHEPDWELMENYIKSLPYGDRL